MQKILAEKLWAVAAPVLVSKKSHVGRPEYDNKKTFFGLLYILENGVKWKCLPPEYGKISTIHGKYKRWVRLGFIKEIFQIARERYLLSTDAFKNWHAVDTSSSKAQFARFSGKSPVDRSKRGIKKNIVVDSRGAPVIATIEPANKHDSKTLPSILRQLSKIRQVDNSILAADSAYDTVKLKKLARQNKIILHASTHRRRNKKNNVPLVRPRGRWIVERTHSWMNNFRSVKTCYSKSKRLFLGFVQLASAIVLIRMT